MSGPEKVPDPESEAEERDDAIIGEAFKWSAIAIALVALAAGLAAPFFFGSPKAEVRETRPVAPPARRALPQELLPSVPFTEITKAAGLKFKHENGAYGDKLLPETMGGGCAFFDYDNDGDQDLLLVNSSYWAWHPAPDGAPQPTTALYANDGRGNFSDVTAATGMDLNCYGMGVAVGDFDNDGWVDAFISAVGGNRLMRNDEGRFTDVTTQAGMGGNPESWSTSCGWLDYDNDGDLDLFVCNYIRWSKEIDLSLECTLVGQGRAYCRPDAFEGAFPYLYRNDGQGRFTDVSEAAGVQVRNSVTGVPLSKSLGVAPVDLDQDGWIDLIVANDTVQNLLFHNLGNGAFEEIGALSAVAFDAFGNVRGAMGIDTGCIRNDRTMAVAIGNFANEMTALYVSQGDALQFADEAVSTGLGPPSRLMLKFGVFFFDYDLDGRLDLLTANGHLEDDINKVQKSQHYEQPPQLFWNCGPEATSEFALVPSEQCGVDFNNPLVGRGATFADIDGDGDLDVLLTSIKGAPRLLRNDQQLSRRWLRVKAVGARANRDAIGAWVDVHVPGRVLSRQVMPTRSYLSQTELPVTFGLGNASRIDKVVVRWPGGGSQEVLDVEFDQLLRIEQRSEAAADAAPAPGS